MRVYPDLEVSLVPAPTIIIVGLPAGLRLSVDNAIANAITAFGRDVRRLRPNIVIDGVTGLDEFTWPGAELHIGDTIITLDSRRGRCPMTTVDPDTLAVDREVLKDIIRRFDGQLALNADIRRAQHLIAARFAAECRG